MTKNTAKLIVFTSFFLLPIFVCQEQLKGWGEAAKDPLITTSEERIKELEADKVLEATIKQKLLDLYRVTLEQARLAEILAAKTAGFEKAKEDVPKETKDVKEALAKPPDETALTLSDEMTLDQLSQMLSQAEMELDAAKKKVDELAVEAEYRKNRHLEVPKFSATAKKRLLEANNEISSPKQTPGDTPEIAQATLDKMQAIKKAAEQEINMYEKELANYESRVDLETLKKDLWLHRVQSAEQTVKKLRELVNTKRQKEAKQAVQEAIQTVAVTHPAVRHIAEENSRLAELRTSPKGPTSKITEVTNEFAEVNKKLTSIGDRFKVVKQKVETAGLTKITGILLQKEQKDLPSLRQLRSRASYIQSEISDSQLQMAIMEEQRQALDDIDSLVLQIEEGLGQTASAAETEEIRRTAPELLKTQREYLDVLSKDYRSYFAKLYDLYEAENQLIVTTRDFAKFINENILWIRSDRLLSYSQLPNIASSARWLLSPSGWKKVVYCLWSDLQQSLAIYLFAIAAFLSLLLQKKKLRVKLQSIGNQPIKEMADSFKYTVEALLFTVLLSSIRPAMLWFVAWRMVNFSSVIAEEFPRAIAAGLEGVAIVWVTLQFLRCLFIPDGLGEAHLKWKIKNPEVILNNLRWLGFILLPAAFIVAAFQWEGSGVYRGSIGRMAFIAAMIGLAIFARRVFHRDHGVSFKPLAMPEQNKKSKIYYLLSTAGTATPLALAVVAGFGFYYTAFVLATRLLISLWLLLAFVLVDSLLGRWLFIIKWKLTIRELNIKQELSEEEDKEKLEAKKAEPKISDISEQTRKLQRMFVGVLLVIGLWATWVDVLPALGILDRVDVWSRTVKENVTTINEDGGPVVTAVLKTVPVTLADVCLSIIIVIVTVAATKNIPGLLEISVLRRLPIDFGVKFAITTIARNVIVIVGIVMAFATIGIGWAKVQWLVAAMTVGLGFGLQEIFANFISGLIILLEQPIRVGDTVTVGEINGTVTKIRARATTIMTWAKKELIVPNKEFITGRLVNWSLSDKIVRVEVPVGIAYGSDTKLAHEILLKVAAEHPLVLDDPKPSALFLDFGSSSLNFELRTYIKGIDFFFEVRDELHTAVDMAFREAKITIAFPQRDLHLRSVNAKLPVENIVHKDEPNI